VREDGLAELGLSSLEQGEVVAVVLHLGRQLLRVFEQFLVVLPGVVDLPDDFVEDVDGMRIDLFVFGLPQAINLLIRLFRERVPPAVHPLLLQYALQTAQMHEGVLDASDLGEEGAREDWRVGGDDVEDLVLTWIGVGVPSLSMISQALSLGRISL